MTMIAKKKYTVFHPDHEMAASLVIDIKNAINSANFLELFEKAGLLNLTADDWYPLQILLDIFNELTANGGAMLDLVAIGMKQMQDVQLPPEFMALDTNTKFSQIVAYYYNYHRGTDVGYVKFRAIAEKHVIYRFKNPMPDNWWYGIVYIVAKRFLPPNMAFKVYYDNDKPLREQGGEETIIHIEWWEKE